MHLPATGRDKPAALALLSAERPRKVGWKQAAGLLFGDWGTSRLYVLGLAFFFARGDSFWRIAKATLSAAWRRPPADREIVPYWHEVVAANRDRLHDRDPDLIFPGEVFELPPPPTA